MQGFLVHSLAARSLDIYARSPGPLALSQPLSGGVG